MRTVEEKARLETLALKLRDAMEGLFQVGKEVNCCKMHRDSMFAAYLDKAEKVLLIIMASKDNTPIQVVEAFGEKLIAEIGTEVDLVKSFLLKRDVGQPAPSMTQAMPKGLQ